MSARSDIINAAASVLASPAPAVESGTPPSETGVMGAAMAAEHEAERETEESDATRVTTEGEPATEAVAPEPAAEAAPEPEPEKSPEPEKPAKPKFDPKAYSSQHAALTRRQKAIQAAEAKVQSLISAKEAEFNAREQRVAELEKLAELDDYELIDRIAKAKNKTVRDILQESLLKVSGYKAEGGKDEGQEPAKQVDPEILKAIREANETARAAQARADALEAKMTEREQMEIAREDAEIIESVTERALGLVSEDTHPYLSVEDPQDIAQEYLRVANEQASYFNQGLIRELPSPEEILEHLEAVQEKKYQKYERLQSRQKGSTSAPTATTVAAPPAPPVSKVPEPLQKSSSGPKALTNATAAQTGPGIAGRISTDRARLAEGAAYLKSKGF